MGGMEGEIHEFPRGFMVTGDPSLLTSFILTKTSSRTILVLSNIPPLKLEGSYSFSIWV